MEFSDRDITKYYKTSSYLSSNSSNRLKRKYVNILIGFEKRISDIVYFNQLNYLDLFMLLNTAEKIQRFNLKRFSLPQENDTGEDITNLSYTFEQRYNDETQIVIVDEDSGDSGVPESPLFSDFSNDKYSLDTVNELDLSAVDCKNMLDENDCKYILENQDENILKLIDNSNNIIYKVKITNGLKTFNTLLGDDYDKLYSYNFVTDLKVDSIKKQIGNYNYNSHKIVTEPPSFYIIFSYVYGVNDPLKQRKEFSSSVVSRASVVGGGMRPKTMKNRNANKKEASVKKNTQKCKNVERGTSRMCSIKRNQSRNKQKQSLKKTNRDKHFLKILWSNIGHAKKK